MSTRNRTSSPSLASKSDLPPARQGKAIKRVKPPLYTTRLNKFIYILALITALLTAYYSYRVVQWKGEVGGWWNLAIGKKPPSFDAGRNARGSGKGSKHVHEDTVEDRINALAEALGMPSQDLAKAVASAVREYVPPASLSSIKEKETGKPAVEELLRGNAEGKTVDNSDDPAPTGIVQGVASGIDSFVGFDEP